MAPLNSLTLLFNGLTLALSLSFLLITLWQDTRKELSQFFAIFLFLVALWNGGSLLLQALTFIDIGESNLVSIAASMVELGFAGSSIAIFTLTAVLVGAGTARFRMLAMTSLMVVLGYQLLLIVTNAPSRLVGLEAGAIRYQLQPLSALFYLIFDTTTAYLAWRHRRKFRSRALLAGIIFFVIGQSLSLLNPELQTLTVSINIGSLSALAISFAILRQEIITPLAERVRQIEAMHRVSLAVTSQIALGTVLDEIATQAAGWLDADGAGIFLIRDDGMRLATVHNMPAQFIGLRIAPGAGMAGSVAESGRSILVEHYRRDWQGVEDLPLANETFGSTICVPLSYGGRVMGVLMVIASQQGRLFNNDDVYLLELLAAQAAVAIAHSQSFEDQRILMREVDSARSQLETVLTSTENPVIAIDRSFRLIFANPAAMALFPIAEGSNIAEVLPSHALPQDYRLALADLRRNRSHIYEISFGGKTYLCHLAGLGRPRFSGWVAILNDVTQLKELDRLKSEMVRMTSHDLKNPLQAALANLELLSDDLADTENEEIHTSLAAIDKQLVRMNRIIGGILDLERVKSGIPTLELCRLKPIIVTAVEELHDLAHSKGIAIETDMAEDLPSFLGDAGQFERAVINLIENAIKFTPLGGCVRIQATRDEGNIRFSVSDTGIGIPPEMHERIFERFFRGQQQGADHISGSGLGLSLVKAVIDNHNGHIWLDSAAQQGTTFHVTIPAARVEQVLS